MHHDEQDKAQVLPIENFDVALEPDEERGWFNAALPVYSEDQEPTKTTFQILDNGDLAEQIIDEETGIPVFLISQKGTGKLSKAYEVTVAGKKYIPLDNSLVTRKIILFPRSAGVYRGYKDLHDDIRKFIHKYADLSPFFLELAVHYVMLTWVFDTASTVSYLGIYSSEKGVGKTRIAKTIGTLCYKPIISTGSPTPAVIYRMMESVRGTMVLNEFDFDNSDLSSEIIKILNNGYEKGMSVLRIQIKGSEVEAFDAFSPKIFTYRKKKKDEAFESRLITINVEETTREDIPIELPSSFENEAAFIRSKLLTYRFQKYYSMPSVNSDRLKGLNRRLRQTLLPILRVVEDEVFLSELLAFATEHQNVMKTELASSWMAETVRTLVAMTTTMLVITPKNFAEQLTLNNVFGDGSVITPKRAGSIARNDLGFRSVRITSGTSKGQYGVLLDKERLMNLCNKYEIEIPPESSLSSRPSPTSDQVSEHGEGSEG